MCIDLSNQLPRDGLSGDFQFGIAIIHTVVKTQVGTLLAGFFD